MKRVSVLVVCVATACAREGGGEKTCRTPADGEAIADIEVRAVHTGVNVDGMSAPFRAWTFGGDVPGPVWRLGLGETKRIKLINDSPLAASLHFMGVSYPKEDDGTESTPSSVVEPGCAHVYTVTANEPGTWPVVNHLEPRIALTQGQYAAVIVPPKDEMPAAHDFVLFAGQLGMESGEGGSAEEGRASSFFMTFNGRAHELGNTIELVDGHYRAHPGTNPSARVGQLVRWHIINVSPDSTHSFGIHGHQFCDRGGLEEPAHGCPNGGHVTNIVEVSPLTTATIEYSETSAGEWMFHCHILDHVADGMMGTYIVTD